MQDSKKIQELQAPQRVEQKYIFISKKEGSDVY